MAHNYTDHNIIRFIYKECDLFEKLEMEFAMEQDSTLLEVYTDLKQGFNILPKVAFSPRKSVLDNILEYSKAAAL